MPTTFNPNEFIPRGVRFVDILDYSDKTLRTRHVKPRDAAMNLSADSTDITDGFNSPIATIYNAQTGTLTYTNPTQSIDGYEIQWGTRRAVASNADKIAVPVSETLTVPSASPYTVTLKYTPAGVAGTAPAEAVVIGNMSDYSERYVINATAGEGKYTISGKVLTFPESAAGKKVIIRYETESETAVKVSKTSESIPEFVTIQIHVWVSPLCGDDINERFPAVYVIDRAQSDISSTDINFSADGGHPFSFKINADPCDESEAHLIDFYIMKDPE